MNTEKLKELIPLIHGEVDCGNAVGLQAAVFYKGNEVFYHTYGMADRETGLLMSHDTICRMYSMTKPITAVAAMILRERGLLDVTKPVAEFLPEFAHMQVLEGRCKVPARRQILISDLLTMSGGLVYPDMDTAGQIMEETFEAMGTSCTTREVMRHIAEAPLAFQPGKRWRYGLSADVVAAVIEVITGMTVGEFYRKEIFEPLEMKDTGFFVPKEKQERFAQLYKQTGKGSCEIERDRHLGLTDGLKPPAYEAGGAGLLSTLEDYSHFAKMLANGGVYKDKRILQEVSVGEFAENRLPEQLVPTIDFPQMKGYGYSNLMRVNLNDGTGGSLGSCGEFGWDGWTGPYFTVDWEHDLVYIMMLQVCAYNNWDLIFSMRDVIYKALGE